MKTHSTISNSFLDVFLRFYNPQTSQADLTINLDQVSKWIGVAKFNLLSTLRSSYQRDKDFAIEKSTNKQGKYGGNNYVKVLITPDCFKRLCMRSRSKQAENVRSYFIELEVLVAKYNEQMIYGMKNEIQKLSKALKPKTADHAGYFYVLMASPNGTIYKIGRTKDLNKRLSTYQTGKLDEVQVVFKYRTDRLIAMEKCVKAWLEPYKVRKYKELYEVNLDIIKRLAQGCDNLGAGLGLDLDTIPTSGGALMLGFFREDN